MTELSERRIGDVLWSPRPGDRPRMVDFAERAGSRWSVALDDYPALWQWSVDRPEQFWNSIWDQFEVISHRPPTQVLDGRDMPGARWFPGATLNYAEHALRGPSGPGGEHDGSGLAVIARSQDGPDRTLSWDELRDAVARAAAGLRRLGVTPGDRVAAYLPNRVEALVAFLATAAIGGVWSSCAPEFGTQAVTDRLQQIEPKVLLVTDGYRYGAKDVDRTADVRTIVAALPTVSALVVVAHGDGVADILTLPNALRWADLVAGAAELDFVAVPFDHPLYTLYSSGTTGIPKAIVHGHGGIVLEHLKMLGLHLDLGPGDRFFWFTTTGWMMWNFLVSGLLVGATVVLFDGDPGHPDLGTLWSMAADLEVTAFGVSAGFLVACRRAGLTPGEAFDLSRLRHVGSTGSPLPAEGFDWVYDAVGKDLVLGSISGGSDVCTAFVGPAPLVPVYRGEISCRCLGADVHAFDATGQPVIGAVGELVITTPMPSMPVGLWNDPDGARLREAYYAAYPGVWRHGDWIEVTDRGSCVISGRSDATLNRGGVRMGTAEFYRVVEQFAEIRDALVVHLDDTDRLCLFLALAPGVALTDELRARVTGAIREQLSPRHRPDLVYAVPDVPRTLTGKKLEVPVKKLLRGASVEAVATEGSLANPSSVRDLLAVVRAAGDLPLPPA